MKSPSHNEMYAMDYIVQNYLAKNYDTWEKSGLLIQPVVTVRQSGIVRWLGYPSRSSDVIKNKDASGSVHDVKTRDFKRNKSPKENFSRRKVQPEGQSESRSLPIIAYTLFHSSMLVI